MKNSSSYFNLLELIIKYTEKINKDCYQIAKQLYSTHTNDDENNNEISQNIKSNTKKSILNNDLEKLKFCKE